MGYSFSNVHIKKHDGIHLQQVKESLCGYLKSQNYQIVNSESESDFALYIFESDSDWFSVCCDAIEFSDMQSIRTICEPISSALHTDVIASSCFDSDFLFLNLINAEESVDAWAKFGQDESKCFHRRSAYKPWEGKVSDIEPFKQILKKRYVFAEEAWSEIAPLLQMLPNQGLFSQDALDEFETKVISVLHFASTEVKKQNPPKLNIHLYSLMPCKIGQDALISATNLGGSSKGLGIAFSGSYVETEELSFRNAQLEYNYDRYPRKTIPLTLEKVKTADDRWIYYAAIPNFKIPEHVKDGLPWKRKMDEEFKRAFGVRFTPEGNPRKALDICVHFIPLSNNEAQCCWCVWFGSGSKKAYIEEFNSRQMQMKALNLEETLLNPDDFDGIE